MASIKGGRTIKTCCSSKLLFLVNFVCVSRTSVQLSPEAGEIKMHRETKLLLSEVICVWGQTTHGSTTLLKSLSHTSFKERRNKKGARRTEGCHTSSAWTELRYRRSCCTCSTGSMGSSHRPHAEGWVSYWHTRLPCTTDVHTDTQTKNYASTLYKSGLMRLQLHSWRMAVGSGGNVLPCLPHTLFHPAEGPAWSCRTSLPQLDTRGRHTSGAKTHKYCTVRWRVR